MAMVPPEARGKLEPAEIFHEILEHRWYLSERAGHEVDIFETARDYIDTCWPRSRTRPSPNKTNLNQARQQLPRRRPTAPPDRSAPDPAYAPNGDGDARPPRRRTPPATPPPRPHQPTAGSRRATPPRSRQPTPTPSDTPRYAALDKCLPRKPKLNPEEVQNRLPARHFVTSTASVDHQDQLATATAGLARNAEPGLDLWEVCLPTATAKALCLMRQGFGSYLVLHPGRRSLA